MVSEGIVFGERTSVYRPGSRFRAQAQGEALARSRVTGGSADRVRWGVIPNGMLRHSGSKSEEDAHCPPGAPPPVRSMRGRNYPPVSRVRKSATWLGHIDCG